VADVSFPSYATWEDPDWWHCISPRFTPCLFEHVSSAAWWPLKTCPSVQALPLPPFYSASRRAWGAVSAGAPAASHPAGTALYPSDHAGEGQGLTSESNWLLTVVSGV